MTEPAFDIPFHYANCIHGDCTCADTCLRQLAYRHLIPTASVLHIANPTRCSKDEHCPYRRDSTPSPYARGFTKMQERMFPSQYEQFANRLIVYFGRSAYYERRNGNRLLPPKEQKVVTEAARKAGVTETFRFDSYEQRLSWED